ncbi:DUF6531 domain-containing protein [Myxococcus stipitatus]|uniref:RHS repeat-associated core domain-containing protein n=1 Tax=Myxococcus stipitatus TaxID=83455 RepID=UPI001F28AD19|nr:RHS repeat-associated core domain-containing protein [Myxococcus stipitatus]MCE9670034.1 DUF6531 domain-containing protein [Myxococcus stipitatus]
MPETVNPAWHLGGLTVAAGATRTESFAASNDVSALVVAQNGNGQGTGEVASAQVSLNGVALGSIVLGQKLAVHRVTLAANNQLDISVAAGSGSVRVSVATLGSLPCAMADTGYLKTGEPTAVFDFTPKGEGTLGVLVVDMYGAGADANILLNGTDMLAGVPSAERKTFAKAVSLAANNHLEVTAQGAAGANVRVALFDADTLPTPLTITEPEHGAYFTSSPIVAAGKYGVDGRSLTINGSPATLVGSDGYRSDVPLVTGLNSITLVMADTCGNVSRVCRAVVLDEHAPVITVQGVTDGSVTQGPVTLTWAAASAYVVTTTATLNGNPIVNNTTISAEGDYDLLVSAVDPDGRVAMKRVGFTIRVSAPIIEVVGLSDGQFINYDLVPEFRAVTPHVELIIPYLDGVPYFPGTPITTEGPHTLGVVSKDKAGNFGNLDLRFTIDKTPPVVAMTGVEEGAYVNAPVVVSYTATDVNMAPEGVTATLDGQPFHGGDTVSAEGPHTVQVTARDQANNRTTSSVSFTVDLTPPQLSLSGVPSAELVAAVVTPTFSATDVNLASVTAQLDGVAFESGTAVSADGTYLLEVRAEDLAGHVTSLVRQFAIDRTPPVITIMGVFEGEHRNAPATISWTVEEPHPGAVVATLDGEAFQSGTTVASGGKHDLVVTATDSVGNTREARRTFFIDIGPPTVTIHQPANGLVTRAAQVAFEVEVSDGSSVDHVEVGGELLTRGEDGRWRRNVSLAEGVNQLVVNVLDQAGNTTSKSVTVVRDSVAPVLSLVSPSEGARVGGLSVKVRGSVSDSTPVTLSLNGAPVTLAADGSTFETDGALVQGANSLVLVARDAAGNEVVKTVPVRANNTPPTLVISEPSDGLVTEASSVTVRGTVSVADSTDTATVIVAGGLGPVSSNGAFQRTVPLSPGAQALRVVATDGYGLRSESTLHVTRNVILPDGGILDAGTPPDAGAATDGGSGGDAGTPPATDAGVVTEAPVLVVDFPAPGAVLGGASVGISGRVQGGTLPLVVKVNGVNASVTARSFAMSLALPEGSHGLTLSVTDAEGRTATTQRDIAVDRTPPHLAVTRPAASPSTVSESPYLVQGEVGDLHLAGVSVAGAPALVLGGMFSASVSLSPGENQVPVVATDEAGNRTSQTLRLTVDGAPPVVKVLSPLSGSESETSLVRVRVQVTAFAELAQVLIGTGAATQVSSGIFEAQVPVALGESTIPVAATDVNGLTGRAEVVVRYRNPATEPLVVTGVLPASGAVEVKPDALISVSFNKAATLASVREGFKVLHQGSALAGGYSLAPGGQTASFIASSPLPEGAQLRVEVNGVLAEVGPGQSSSFASELTVRRPLTRVRGFVMDDDFQPLPGVRVALEGTDTVVRSGPDGNWSFVTQVSGPRVVRFEGGVTSSGRPLPTVRRLIVIEPEAETVDVPLALTPVDTLSASRVDTTRTLHVDFAGRHETLAIDGPAESLVFEDGTTRGALTATRIEPVALPLRLESNATPTAVWQVGPAGIRVQKPVLLQFPNVTSLEPGRYAVVLTHEPRHHLLARTGLARVSADGRSVVAEAPLDIRSVELAGYMALTDEQDAIVRKALEASGGGAPDGGIEGRRPRILPPAQPPAPLWKRALDSLLLGEAHAQAFLGVFSSLDQNIQEAIQATVTGTLRAPLDQQLSVAPTEEFTALIAAPRVVDFPYRLPVSLIASRTMPGAADERIDAFLSAKSSAGVEISPPAGEQWQVSSQDASEDELRLEGNVELVRGTTVITLGGRLAAEERLVTVTVTATPVADAGVDTYRLSFTTDSQGPGVGQSLPSAVRFPNMRVTVTGPGPTMSGVTGETGGYGIPVQVPGGRAMGIACAEVPLGPRPLLGKDPETGAAVVQGMVMASYPTCSSTFTVTSGFQARADILVDARLLHGALYFVDREGRSLARDCAADAHSQFDSDAGTFATLSNSDVLRTEVHFFRAGDLEHPIAQFTVGVPETQCEPGEAGQRIAQGRYARMRVGPTAPSKRSIRERCRELNPAIVQDPSAPAPDGLGDDDRAFYEAECRENVNNFLRLAAGDPLVVVAVNHATGFTGMTRVRVPPIVKTATGPDGKCALDEAQGPLEVEEGGKTFKLSRCSVQELGIEAPVVLYPPEIDVRVWRHAEGEGLRQDSPPTLVRHGGAATTRDSYVHVDTHWRVRTMALEEWRLEDGGVRPSPVDAGLPQGWFDGGISPCKEPTRSDGGVSGAGRSDSGEPCLPGMLVDEGVSGRLLETCSEYGASMASSLTRMAACRRGQDLEDVPPGVPPLAGRVVRVTQSAAEEPAVAQFGVVPGRGSAALQASMRVVTPGGEKVVLGSLPSANYYLHVVGHEVFPRDQDGNGVLSPQERNSRPPDFTEPVGEHLAGLPSRALGLKNVYTSAEPDGFRVLRYDQAREHEFRVIGLSGTKVTAENSSGDRELDGESAQAEPDDLSYTFLGALLEPEDPGRANTPVGDYVVRFGGDAFGVECDVEISSNSITGTCDNDFIDDVLSANDLLYVELYLSGNADNILYRFNLMGVSPRVDLLTAGSAFTARRSVEKGATGEAVLDRPLSIPAAARFSLDPSVIRRGRVKVCTSDSCESGKLLKEADVELLGDGSYRLTELSEVPGRKDLVQLPTPGLNGARQFLLPVPPQLVAMPGSGAETSRLYLVQDVLEPEPRHLVQTLGRPKGYFEGLHARAPGQLTVQGINVADGHLSFEHEDFAVPQLAEVVRFARTYNNQSGLVSSVGVGWVHNYDGFVQEEKLGRYTVVVAGQSYDFPACVVPEGTRVTTSCSTDRSHGLTLDIEERDGRSLARVRTAEGAVFEFGTPARGLATNERRRWLLDRYHDGRGRDDGEGWTVLTYKPETNLVAKVARTPGRLEVVFSYTPIDALGDVVVARLRNAARTQGLELLDKVVVRRKADGVVLHALDFAHDERGNLVAVSRTSALPATQSWEYEYVTPATQPGGGQPWLASNELKTAMLKLSPPAGGTPVVQWQATYGREAQPGHYAHVNPLEVVTSVVGTGMPAPGWRVTAGDAMHRTVTRPDGVSVSISLNEYGNASSTQLAQLAASTTSWGSSVRGGPVQVDATMSSTGRGMSQGINNRLQVDSVTLTTPPPDGLPSPGATSGPLWAVTERHASGRPVATQVSTGTGTAIVRQPRSNSGDSLGVTVSDPQNGVLFSAQQFPTLDGVVLSGVDASGNTVTHGGHELQPLGLPTSTTVQRTLQAAGGLASYTVSYGYDALGNRTSEKNETTGAKVELVYDAVGRLLSRKVAGQPEQLTTYEYALEDNALTVTEHVELLQWERVQTQVTKFSGGLLRSRSYTYGANRQATVAYDTYKGDRLESYLDARGKRHTLSYDAAGRLRGESVDGVAAFWRELDAEGKVTESRDSLGLTTRIRYDVLGRPVQWEYESKRTGDECPGDCQFEDVESVVLNAAGSVVQRTFGTLAKKHTLESTVDALGRELSVKSAATSHGGVSSTTTYDAAGRVRSQTDLEMGLSDTYDYDDVLGRMTRQVRTVQSANGPRTLTETRAYADTASGTTTVTVVRTLSGRGPGTDGQREETRTYLVDTQGRVRQMTEMVDGQQSTHRWDYDALGRVAKYTDPSNRVTKQEFDNAGNLILLTVVASPKNVVTAFTHDGAGNVETQTGPHEEERWSMTYDPLGRLLSREIDSTPLLPRAKWSYVYPGNGVSIETLPDDVTIARTYNARGLVESEVQSRGAEDSRSITSRYDGPWAKRQASVEGTSKTVVDRSLEGAIDDRGRVRREVETWETTGHGYQYTTSTGWVGRQATTNETWTMRGQDMGGRTVLVEVDGLGNIVRRTQAGATDTWDYYADGKALRMVPYGFDADHAATTWSYDSSGRLKTQRFGTEEATYSYYADGLLLSVQTPDNRVRTLTYNNRGLPETETFGRGTDLRRTRYESYDGAGHAEVVRHADGTDSETAWGYKYGPRGELVQVTQPGNASFTYKYDGLSRVVLITPPPGSVMAPVSYTYDFLGREKTRHRGDAAWTTTWTNGSSEVRNELGERVERVLDGRGRVAREVFKAGPPRPDASGVLRVFKDLEAVDYEYNGLDQLRTAKEYRGANELVRSQKYDARDRLWVVSSENKSVTYGYHDSNALRSIQSPAGTVNYGVDGLQRLSRVTLADGTSLDMEWEPGGGRVLTIGNQALKHSYCHDGRGRLVSVTHDAQAEICPTPIGAPRLRYQYTYDERDNRLAEVVDRNEPGMSGEQDATQYGYDAADRLTGVRYGSGESVLYRLAPDGARRGEKLLSGYAGALGEDAFDAVTLPQRHWTYDYDALGGLLATRDVLNANAMVAAYQVDRAGRRVKQARNGVEQFFHFAPADRLVEVESNTGAIINQVTYRYDYAGLRRARVTTSGATSYLWGEGTLIEEQLPGGSGVALYQRAAGLTLAAGSERILQDGLGSVVGRLNASGFVSVSSFDAWGGYRDGLMPMSTQASIGYTGHAWDGEAGFIYAQQRWLESSTGHFLSEDPVSARGYLSSPNELGPWNYAAGNPVRFVDRDGRMAKDPIGCDFIADARQRKFCETGNVAGGFEGVGKDCINGNGGACFVKNSSTVLAAGVACVAGGCLLAVRAAVPTIVAGFSVSVLTRKHDGRGGEGVVDPVTGAGVEIVSLARKSGQCRAAVSSDNLLPDSCADVAIGVIWAYGTARVVRNPDPLGIKAGVETGLMEGVAEVGGIPLKAPSRSPPAWSPPLLPPSIQAASVAGENGFWGVLPEEEALFFELERWRAIMMNPDAPPPRRMRAVAIDTAVDKVTGDVSVGISGGGVAVPNASPALVRAAREVGAAVEAGRLPDLGRSPISCAESYCANQLLLRMGEDARVSRLRFGPAYFMRYTGKGVEPYIEPKPVCTNCSTVFQGAEFSPSATFD